jgi:hypothetical protein
VPCRGSDERYPIPDGVTCQRRGHEGTPRQSATRSRSSASPGPNGGSIRLRPLAPLPPPPRLARALVAAPPSRGHFPAWVPTPQTRLLPQVPIHRGAVLLHCLTLGTCGRGFRGRGPDRRRGGGAGGAPHQRVLRNPAAHPAHRTAYPLLPPTLQCLNLVLYA